MITDAQADALLERLARGSMLLSRGKALEVGAALAATVPGCKRRQGAWQIWQVSLDGYDVRLTLADGEGAGHLTKI